MKRRRGPYKTFYSIHSINTVPRSSAYKKVKKNNAEDNLEDGNKNIFLSDNMELSIETDLFADFIQQKDHNHHTIETPNAASSEFDDFADAMNETYYESLPTSDEKDKKRFKSLNQETCNCTGMNVGEVFLVFMNIFKKHSLTWNVILDVFIALNFIFNKKVFPVTKFMIKQLLKVTTDSLTYHVICSECEKYLGKYSELKCNVQCECGTIISPLSMGSFFIEIDVIDQLKKLFSNPDIANSLEERFHRQKKRSDNFEDLYDGAHYKKQIDLFQNKYNFSYTFNTDGCQPADKGKITAWPIFLMLHELPDYLRKKYMILQGLWVSKVEPNFNIFLQPFVDQANYLSSKGFEWSNSNKKIISKFFPLGCCVDSVARCAMLSMKRFNGICGCTFCEHPTVSVEGVRKYPMLKTVPKKRTDSSIKSQMIEAAKDKKVTLKSGVWGPSCLMNVQHFDLANGMIVDFMHSCLLGVIKLYTDIIMSMTKAEFYVGSPAHIRIINQRLQTLKLPTCVANVPKDIDDKNNWKASHWMIWLLFGSLPCLNGLLSKKYLNHLALLVTAINILLQDSISPDELKTAKMLLIKFVYYFNEYFGDQHMHYNVHLLLHLHDTVENWGPLWTINAFPFENQNKNLLHMKKSNFHIAKQIAIILLTYQQIPLLQIESFISERTRDFCNNLNSNRLKKAIKIKDVTLLGSGKSHTLTEKEIMSLRCHIDVKKITECKKYTKMIYQSCRYTTSYYSKCKKTNDSIFETKDNKFGIITSLLVIKHNNVSDVFVFFKSLTLISTSPVNDPDVMSVINLKKCILSSNRINCIKYSMLHRPCIICKCDDEYYLSLIVKGAIGRCLN